MLWMFLKDDLYAFCQGELSTLDLLDGIVDSCIILIMRGVVIDWSSVNPNYYD